MEIIIRRRWKGKNTTLGVVKIDGAPYGFILEDIDRWLHSDMPLDEILKIKIKGRTAIPTGRYEVVVNYSPKFKRLMPLITKVPGYSGIRIHSGNRHEHTDGCPLPGLSYTKDAGDYVVLSSASASERMYKVINDALGRGEKVWVTVERDFVN